MATHSSILTWRIPWTEEPLRLQSIGSQKVRHNWGNLAGRAHISKSYLCPPHTPLPTGRLQQCCLGDIQDHRLQTVWCLAPQLLDSLAHQTASQHLQASQVHLPGQQVHKAYITLLAYGERCQIRGLWTRRFSFRTRDQAWLLKSFGVAEFYSSKRGQRKLLTQTSEGGWRAPPSLSKGAIYFFNWLLQ